MAHTILRRQQRAKALSVEFGRCESSSLASERAPSVGLHSGHSDSMSFLNPPLQRREPHGTLWKEEMIRLRLARSAEWPGCRGYAC
jgi:hypothetical protein